MGPATEEERRLLHQQAEAALGREAANVLMKVLPPYHWPDLVTKDHLRGELGKHTLIIVSTLVATLISLAGVAFAAAQLAR